MHRTSVTAVVMALAASITTAAEPIATHPPIRPLPTASNRPVDSGAAKAYFVDPTRGDDTANGTEAKPWRTLTRAVKDRLPGEVIYLRGGVYFEHVEARIAGTPEKPIVIRAYPGELVILDGGIPEFQSNPAAAWEPSPGGAEGEYRSTKAYPVEGARKDGTNVLGHFADTMIPLQGYRFLTDLRSSNVYWNITSKVGDQGHIYCGPGLFQDSETGRIHVRLAPTKMPYLPEGDNYRGETDPRKLALVVAGNRDESPITFSGCRNVKLQDVAVRGARTAAITILGSENIELDGVTAYGGQSCVRIAETGGVRMVNTTCRGIAAPWTFRGSLKYRAIESRIVSASAWTPGVVPNRDFEFAYCEFTDSVDGVFLGGVRGVKYHHNYLDNVTDDGLFLTSGTAYDGTTYGGDLEITQNLFSRCLTTFAFGVGHGRQRAVEGGLQTGSGAKIARNVFDFRGPIKYHQPKGPEDKQELVSHGRVAGDHGSPAWEPIDFYHNTVLNDTDRVWGYFFGNGMSRGAHRRVFNNIVVDLTKAPGATFPPPTADFAADANLFWTTDPTVKVPANPFAKFQASKEYAASKSKYPPGWGTHDLYADPRFVKLPDDRRTPPDLRLRPDSPAVNAGVTLPGEWPDPLRAADAGKPDLGAIPLNAEVWRVGVGGRFSAFGDDLPPIGRPELLPMTLARPYPLPKWEGKPAALVIGYPAPVSDLIAHAFRKQGAGVEEFNKQWLDPKEYKNYSTVAVVGSLTRAKTTPDKYSPADLKIVDQYLRNGGTLLVVLQGRLVFQTPEGGATLNDWIATAPPRKTPPKLDVLLKDHPWVRHLDPTAAYPWQRDNYPGELILRASQGERIIGDANGSTVLYRVPIGKGQLIYMGFDVHAALPYSRDKDPTPAMETAFDGQMQILNAIAETLFPAKK